MVEAVGLCFLFPALSLSSPFSLPPFESLGPMPLPENTPPYCAYPQYHHHFTVSHQFFQPKAHLQAQPARSSARQPQIPQKIFQAHQVVYHFLLPMFQAH